VNPDYHCLAFDGDVSKYQEGGSTIIACGLYGADATDPASCATGTHQNPGRPARFHLPGPAYVVRVKPSSPAVKAKVLSGAYLLVSDVPDEVFAAGGTSVLLAQRAPPLVWKLLFDLYPGREVLTSMYQAAAFSRINA
jgi:hypothetical protein